MICPHCGKETISATIAESMLKKHISQRHKKETTKLKKWYRTGYRGK